MDDWRREVVVEVLDPSGGVECDGDATSPRSGKRGGGEVVKMVMESAIAHEFIDQHSFMCVIKESKKAYEVFVVNARQRFEFIKESIVFVFLSLCSPS